MIKNARPYEVPYFYAYGKKTTKGPLIQRLKKVDHIYRIELERFLGSPDEPFEDENPLTIEFLSKKLRSFQDE